MSDKMFRMFIKKSEMYEKGTFKEIDATSRLIKPLTID
jgi:type II secretory pathway component PulF